MKSKDLKVGETYGYQSNTYTEPRPVVLLDTRVWSRSFGYRKGDLRLSTRRPGKDRSTFTGVERGYLVVFEDKVDALPAPDATEEQMNDYVKSLPKSVSLVNNSKIIGTYAEAKADYEAAEAAKTAAWQARDAADKAIVARVEKIRERLPADERHKVYTVASGHRLTDRISMPIDVAERLLDLEWDSEAEARREEAIAQGVIKP